MAPRTDERNHIELTNPCFSDEGSKAKTWNKKNIITFLEDENCDFAEERIVDLVSFKYRNYGDYMICKTLTAIEYIIQGNDIFDDKTSYKTGKFSEILRKADSKGYKFLTNIRPINRSFMSAVIDKFTINSDLKIYHSNLTEILSLIIGNYKKNLQKNSINSDTLGGHKKICSCIMKLGAKLTKEFLGALDKSDRNLVKDILVLAPNDKIKRLLCESGLLFGITEEELDYIKKANAGSHFLYKKHIEKTKCEAQKFFDEFFAGYKSEYYKSLNLCNKYRDELRAIKDYEKSEEEIEQIELEKNELKQKIESLSGSNNCDELREAQEKIRHLDKVIDLSKKILQNTPRLRALGGLKEEFEEFESDTDFNQDIEVIKKSCEELAEKIIVPEVRVRARETKALKLNNPVIPVQV